jgi:hypothetical protein
MANGTKEQVYTDAMASFQSVEVTIGKTTATLRELSDDARRALDDANYERNTDGKFREDDKGFLIAKDPEQYLSRWIAATITPAFTVDEISKWPQSLRKRLCEAAKKINGIEPAAETAKNS